MSAASPTPPAAATRWAPTPTYPNVGFRARLDTTQLTDGPHELLIAATHHRGDYPLVTASRQTIHVDNGCSDATGPTVTLTSSAAGSTVDGTVTIAAQISDATGVDKARFFVDQQSIHLDTAPPWQTTWDASSAADGSHEILVRAFDVCGNVTPARITVHTGGCGDMTPPSVQLTAPADGATGAGAVGGDGPRSRRAVVTPLRPPALARPRTETPVPRRRSAATPEPPGRRDRRGTPGMPGARPRGYRRRWRAGG